MPDRQTIKFGTDGWRGIIADDFTFDNVRRVAAAIAAYYKRRAKICVGYDTRFLSDKFARALAEVLVDAGINVVLSDKAIPTPALSFAVRRKKMTAGVMITASHNPGEYNGIKIKTSSGAAAPQEVTRKVEKLLKPSYRAKNLTGSLTTCDFIGAYIDFLRSYIDLARLRKTNFRVLVDAMYGSGNGWVGHILKGTGVRLDFIRNEVNPAFSGLRPEPVIDNLKATVNKMKEKKYDLSLVLDGDADRIAAFASERVFIHPQKILGLLVLHLFQNRRMKGAVVKTIAGTTLIDNIARRLKLKLFETPVGFKYISDLMEREDILVGGEEAGGMGIKNYIPERDGTLAGLLLLEMMAYRRQPMLNLLNEMEAAFGRFYYLRQDLTLSRPIAKGEVLRFKKIGRIAGKRVIQVKDFDGVKLICADGSWLMLRASGTEPLVRVYAESTSINRSRQILKLGIKLVSAYAL